LGAEQRRALARVEALDRAYAALTTRGESGGSAQGNPGFFVAAREPMAALAECRGADLDAQIFILLMADFRRNPAKHDHWEQLALAEIEREHRLLISSEETDKENSPEQQTQTLNARIVKCATTGRGIRVNFTGNSGDAASASTLGMSAADARRQELFRAWEGTPMHFFEGLIALADLDGCGQRS
jgi:hypothetical protein